MVFELTFVALPQRGEQLDAAKSTVEALGLKVNRSDEESDEPENQVLSQQPNAGSVPQGSTVTLKVAIPRAAETTTVPSNLVGMTEDQAKDALGGAELNVGTRETQESDQWPAGVVIGSDPRGGAEVPVGTQVSLIVSTGPGPSNGGNNGGGNNGGGNGNGGDSEG